METTYKALSPEDLDLVTAMMGEFYAIDQYPIDPAWSRQMLAAFVANDQLGKGWLILSQGDVVGYVILTFVFSFEFKGRIAFIDELYLREKARGKGIGHTTIAFIKR